MAKFLPTKSMEIIDLILLYTHNNKDIIESAEKDKKCGCVCCKKIMKAGEIKNFENGSAICPFCGMITIVPGNKGIEINPKILQTYNRILTEQIGSPELEILFPRAMIYKLKIFHANKVTA